MWRRVYLATLRGPDPGHAIDVGVAGRDLPPPLPVEVGRGPLSDYQLDDPGLARQGFSARAGVDRFGRKGVWVATDDRERHHRVGSRFRRGRTTFEVRVDPTPTDSRPSATGPLLLRVLPVVASLGFISMWVLPAAGPWPLIGSAVLTPAVMLLAHRVRRHRLPDPARLLRPAPGPVPEPEEGHRVDVGDATGGRRLRPATVTIHPGQTVGIAGPGASGLGRWVAAQFLHRGATLSTVSSGSVSGTTIRLPETDLPRPSEPITIWTAPSPSLLPASLSFTLAARAGHNREVTQSWFDAIGARAGSASLPDLAHLRDHLPADISAAWKECGDGLSAPIGLAAGEGRTRAVEIDLAGTSPHALIAGTTGAGKSELLAAWLLGLAARYPPTRLAMALVDYKGGATFGPLADLPHVIEVLTDLDHSATTRALTSLRVEIHRREQLLNAAGATDVHQYNLRAREPLARLLIAVDEFRVLADEYPQVLEQLVRVAAQGRSLGIHVILATQRPGGVITPDIRANMATRACLRVVDETDSLDVLGSTDAADLPAVPGRMVLRQEEQLTVQTLWAGDLTTGIVARCRRAATDHPALATLHRPWAPALPTLITEIPSAPPGRITLGVSDLPAEQRHGVWTLPSGAMVTICGPPRSGRTSTARLLARGLMAERVGVHTISREPLVGPGEAGSRVSLTDPPMAIALLKRLRDDPGTDGLIIDDAHDLARTLDDALGAGTGEALLEEVLRTCRHQGRFVAPTTPIPTPGWARNGEVITLPPSDPHAFALSGLAGPPPRQVLPGRGIVSHDGHDVHVQIPHLASAPPVPAALTPDFVIPALPRQAVIPDEPALGVCIGVGAGGPVALPCPPGGVTLIVGPAGSGRSALTGVILARARLCGFGDRIRPVEDVHLADHSDLDGHLEALRAGAHLVATTTPEGLAGGYHPLSMRIRHAEHTVYLGLMPRSVVGVNLAEYISPGIPGRALVVSRGRFTPVQLGSGEEGRT